MSGSDAQAAKIVSLESAVAHLQHEFEQLNGVVIEQVRVLERLKDSIVALESRLESPGEDNEPFDPHLDRPPHY